MSDSSEAAEQVVAALHQQGYLVELKISSWSGKARLEEADLGLEGLTEEDLHRLGSRILVPREELAIIGRIASRARARLDLASYAFPIGNARFVPQRVLGNVLADLSEIRSEFQEAVGAFTARFEEVAEQMRRTWRENAGRIKTELEKDDAWLAAFVERLDASYPPVTKVRDSFSMEWSLFQFALPQGLRTERIMAAEALQAAQLAAEARAQLEAQVSAFVGEAAVELRRRAGELCAHVAKQVQESGEKVSERTLQPLRDLIAQFRALDFTGDKGFAEELDTLQKSWLGADKDAGTAKHLREDADYRQSLSAALQTMADRALAEREAAASEALNRFLEHGNMGRAVAMD